MSRHISSASLTFAVASALLLGAATTQAQSVSGAFTLAGKPLKPAHVAAFRIRNQNAPRTLETYVMLTQKPVDAARIGAGFMPLAAAINDPAVANADYLALHVTADGVTVLNAHVGGTQYLDTSGSMMGEAGSLTATCKENTASRIACTVKTAKPVKTMDGPAWTLDITFSAAVNGRTPGKPLPADGGPAGKALLDLVTAVGGKSLAPILAGLTPGQAASYQDTDSTAAENLASAKDALSFRLPRKPKVTGGEIMADDFVVLEVEGTQFEMRNLYLVEMRLVGGKWKYDASFTAGILR